MIAPIDARRSLGGISLGPLALGVGVCYLGCLLILSYGLSAATVGPIPVHHAVLGVALIGSLFYLRTMPMVLLIAPVLLAIASLRVLAGDVGFWALRDAAQVIDMQWVLVGWALVAAGLHRRFARYALPLCVVAALYWLTYPLQDTLEEIGPRLGLHGTGLFGHYSGQFMAGVMLCALVLWADKVRPLVLVALVGMLSLFVLMTMSRLTVGSTLACLVYLTAVGRLPVWIPAVGVPMAVLAVVVAELAGWRLETRYGMLSGDLLGDAALSVVGRGDNEGAAEGIYQRLSWWWSGIMGTLDYPGGWLWGQGYGVVLTDHGTAGDIVTRELHNSWISAFCRLGLIGLLGLMSLFGYLSWQLLKQRDDWRHLGVIIVVFVLALTLFEPGFENPYAAAVIWTVLGGISAHLALRRAPIRSAGGIDHAEDLDAMPGWMLDRLPVVVMDDEDGLQVPGQAAAAQQAAMVGNQAVDLPVVVVMDGQDEADQSRPPLAWARSEVDDDIPIVVLD